jgi:beta-glucosidase
MGYRCEGVAGRARWPFGFGLSYTEFAYDGLRVTVDGESVRFTVGVTNIGQLEGKEVVQVYVRGSKSAAVWRPERELKAFTKISLQPGERKVVVLDADLKIAGSYWDERGHTWRLEEGKYEVEVGDLLGEFTVAKTVEWNHL